MISSPEKNVSEFGFIPGQHVADFGSGAGHYSLALSRVLGPEGRVYSIDLRQDILTRLSDMANEENLHNISVLWGDIEKKGGSHLRDNLVDGVIFSNILFQLNNIESTVTEAARILKPGGRICLVEWSDASPIPHVHNKTGEDIVTEEKARKLFEGGGFVFERRFDAGEHHYGLLFKKII
jgi:ubiquinone/menaquinone biosynthesis C-methylase UbiE